MERRRRNAGRARLGGADSTLDAIRRPPLRIRFRYEPADCLDAHPTIEVAPLPPRLAIDALLAVTHPNLSTLLVDARRTLGGRSQRLSRHQTAVLERCSLSRSLPLDTAGLRQLGLHLARRGTIARIDGPVDAGDALALELALLRGATPLEADLRATAVLQISPLGHVWSQWRSPELGRAFVTRAVASFVACAAGLDPAQLAPVDAAALLGLPREGCVIRPRDVRIEDGCIVAKVRTPRGIATRVVHDLATGAWITA